MRWQNRNGGFLGSMGIYRARVLPAYDGAGFCGWLYRNFTKRAGVGIMRHKGTLDEVKAAMETAALHDMTPEVVRPASAPKVTA